MNLSNKLAFEIWVGIIILVVVIGGAAGVTLMLGNTSTSSLARTQANSQSSKPSPTPDQVVATSSPEVVAQKSFASQEEITSVAQSVGSLFTP